MNEQTNDYCGQARSEGLALVEACLAAIRAYRNAYDELAVLEEPLGDDDIPWSPDCNDGGPDDDVLFTTRVN